MCSMLEILCDDGIKMEYHARKRIRTLSIEPMVHNADCAEYLTDCGEKNIPVNQLSILMIKPIECREAPLANTQSQKIYQ